MLRLASSAQLLDVRLAISEAKMVGTQLQQYYSPARYKSQQAQVRQLCSVPAPVLS